MLKQFKILYYFLCLIPVTSQALDVKNAAIGENRIKYTFNDTQIKITSYNKKYRVWAKVEPSSFDWVRVQSTLLVPRVRVKIKLETTDPSFSLHYKTTTLNFQQSQKNSYTELYYSLFERKKIEIYKHNKLIATVAVNLKKSSKKKVLIDYTCSRNSIEIIGLEDEHFSIGCQTRRIGSYGKETPMLEVKWISPELKIISGGAPPYHAAFLNKRPVNIEVLNTITNKTKTLTIKSKIPKRLHRLFTAYGFGPYALHTERINKNDKKLTKKAPIAPALFFYLNYKISEGTSIRGFDAAIFQESKFNNAGLYLGSDFGHALDSKLYFTTLLGVQYLYFKFDDDTPEVSEPIFPQGVEFMYRHAFDIPNYIISGGIFLSTTNDIDYENIWIRWGKNYFWELNLIAWGKDNFQAKTWGLSVGFPFKGFL